MYSTRQLFGRLKNHPEEYPLFFKKLSAKLSLMSISEKFFLPTPDEITPEALENVLSYPLDSFFKRSHELRLSNGLSEDFIFDTSYDSFTDAIRFKNKIILYNSSLDKVQSWYNPRLDVTSKHEIGFSGSSVYFKGSSRKNIEFEVFNKGVGFIDPRSPSNRLYLFHAFDLNIGVSKREKTNIVKLQIDRVKRSGSYACVVHGYPILRRELTYRSVPPIMKSLL